MIYNSNTYSRQEQWLIGKNTSYVFTCVTAMGQDVNHLTQRVARPSCSSTLRQGTKGKEVGFQNRRKRKKGGKICVPRRMPHDRGPSMCSELTVKGLLGKGPRWGHNELGNQKFPQNFRVLKKRNVC